MKTLRNTLFAVLIVGVFALVLFFRQGSRNPLCTPVLFAGEPHNHPDEIIARVIDRIEGLPQADTNLTNIEDPRIIVAVENWRIRSAVVQNSSEFAKMLRNDNTVIHYSIDLDVTWKDESVGIVQWTSWRYGWVSCPIAVFRGSGPLGEIRIVQLTPAPPKQEETPEATPEG